MHPISHKLNWSSGFHYHSQVDHLQICFITQAHHLNYRFASPYTHSAFPVMRLMATSNNACSKLNIQFFFPLSWSASTLTYYIITVYDKFSLQVSLFKLYDFFGFSPFCHTSHMMHQRSAFDCKP